MPKVRATKIPIAFTPPTAAAVFAVTDDEDALLLDTVTLPPPLVGDADVVAGPVRDDVCAATSALAIVAEITVVVVTTLVPLWPLTVSTTVSVVVVQPVVWPPLVAVTVK
jgi:hypothetical protein